MDYRLPLTAIVITFLWFIFSATTASIMKDDDARLARAFSFVVGCLWFLFLPEACWLAVALIFGG